MKLVNGWVQIRPDELCGATHIWKVRENRFPCLCGKRVLLETVGGFVDIENPDPPNAARRYGVMSHFVEGECECHPPAPPGEAYFIQDGKVVAKIVNLDSP